MILNRGPHGPPGGNLQVLGGNTEHLGNWGGMDPFGGNQQKAINSPGGGFTSPLSPVHTKRMTLLYRPTTSRHNDALLACGRRS